MQAILDRQARSRRRRPFRCQILVAAAGASKQSLYEPAHWSQLSLDCIHRNVGGFADRAAPGRDHADELATESEGLKDLPRSSLRERSSRSVYRLQLNERRSISWASSRSVCLCP
jgi:hypothetical protein